MACRCDVARFLMCHTISVTHDKKIWLLCMAKWLVFE